MMYKVGQVVYAVLRKEAVVYPVQIVEEITKKTLDGEAVTYMVRVGSDPQKVVAIVDVDGEIFDSSEAARLTLIERVSASIAQRIEKAVDKAREWYPSGFEARSEDPLSFIKRSETTMVHPATKEHRAELTELGAELQQEAEEQAVLHMDDGSVARIRSVRLPDALQ